MNNKKAKKQIQTNQNNNLISQSSQKEQSPNPISIAKLIQENKNLSSALEQEILKNEEQEKYIQTLKETIENNLYNSGFAEILASSKEYQQFQEFNKGQGKTMADFVVDFIKFKAETNKDKINNKNLNLNKKDFSLSLNKIKEKDDLINKLKNDINVLEEENKNLKNKMNECQNRPSPNEYESIPETLEQNVINYEQEYKDLLIEYEKLKTQNMNENNGMNTIEEINKLKSIINDKEREIQDLYDNLNMVSSKENIMFNENKNNKQKLHNCNLCIDKLKFEKNSLNEEFCNLQQKYEELIIEYDKNQNKFNNLNINFDELKKEYNSLLNEKNMQEKELQNQMDFKYAKDLELNDMENKFNEDMDKILKENQKLNEALNKAKIKIEELNDNILNLKEINELTNKQLREKIENEQIILKENLKYKNAIENLNLQHDENNKNLTKELNSYKNLTKTFNTIKSENIDLQKQITESNQENSKLIFINNQI